MKSFFKKFIFVISIYSALVLDVAAYDAEVVGSETFSRWMSEISNWGRWGKEDELGTLNLITPDKRVKSAELVKKGVAISLARNMEKEPSINNPNPLEHEVQIATLNPSSVYSEDRISINYHGLVHSHLDALCHIFHNGKMYNGYSQDLVVKTGCQKLSVNINSNGIFTRGVLVDLADLKGASFLKPGTVILNSDLDEWERITGVKIKPGDAVFFRTGRWAGPKVLPEGKWFAGLHPSVARWLKDRDVSIVGTDYNSDIGLVEAEVFPFHKLLIVAMGTQLFDNLDLERLSMEAKRQGRWEFLFTVAPLRVEGGTGSPVNPTAIF